MCDSLAGRGAQAAGAGALRRGSWARADGRPLWGTGQLSPPRPAGQTSGNSAAVRSTATADGSMAALGTMRGRGVGQACAWRRLDSSRRTSPCDGCCGDGRATFLFVTLFIVHERSNLVVNGTEHTGTARAFTVLRRVSDD